MLSSVSVPWVRQRSESVDQGEAVHMVAHAPVIAVDHDGDLCGVRFHERSMGTIDVADDLVDDYYRALIEFTVRIRSSDFQWEHGLLPGEAIVFDNQRVLHGRSGFDGDPGRRHLRLCTVDRDQVHSNLRLLRAEFAPGTEEQKLTAGKPLVTLAVVTGANRGIGLAIASGLVTAGHHVIMTGRSAATIDAAAAAVRAVAAESRADARTSARPRGSSSMSPATTTSDAWLGHLRRSARSASS